MLTLAKTSSTEGDWLIMELNDPTMSVTQSLDYATESTELFTEFADRDDNCTFDLLGFSSILPVGHSGYCFDLHEISLVFSQFL